MNGLKRVSIVLFIIFTALLCVLQTGEAQASFRIHCNMHILPSSAEWRRGKKNNNKKISTVSEVPKLLGNSSSTSND